MKQNTIRNKSDVRASVLVVALVVCAIGTLGVLATVSIIGARSSFAESHFKGLERRVIFNNSKALGREVILRKYLPEDDVEDAEVAYNYDVWASVKVGAFSDAPLSFGDAARTHPTGAAPFRAFSKDVTVKVIDGGVEHPIQYQMRSYNPALGGDLLSIHPTIETATEAMRIAGDLKVNGRAVFWEGIYHQTNASTVRSEEVIVPAADRKVITTFPDGTTVPVFGGLPAANLPYLVLENPAGTAIKPSNYVGFTQTMGAVPGGKNYDGELDIVDNAVTGVNSYVQRLTDLGGETLVDGAVGLTDGLGTPTVSPKINDSMLIALIQDPDQTEASVVGQLAANSPLSSDVMMALLGRVPAVSDSYLLPLMNSQAPLPDDIMIALSDPATPVNPATKKTLLKNTGFSYLCNGKGAITINIESIYLPNLILEDVSQLILEGQYTGSAADAAKLLQPRAIVINNADNIFLSHVYLEGETNQRRIVLAVSQTGVLDGADLVDTNGTPSTLGTNQTYFVFGSPSPYVQWKMVTETEGVSQHWDVTGVLTAKLFGGIRADHSIRVSGGLVTLEQEEDTEFLESLVSRNAWLEIYK